LVWINGAFGAGKTQTAHELLRRLPSGHVADPELLGFALQKMLPSSSRADFQDLPQWRACVVATLLQAEAAFDGPIIVPMSIVRADYYEEMVGGLRSRGAEVKHYTLTASAETLRARLRQRPAWVIRRMLGREDTWAMQQIDRCVTALTDSRYATHVPTDDATADQVVEKIAEDAGLALTSRRLSPVRYQMRRVAVGVRHVRL
jgi:hypothetical protein